MTHYLMNHEQPSAVVMKRNKQTCNLDETKLYQDNTVFLENNDEFSIRLFNPTQQTIGVKISINGNEQNSILVLKPAQDVIIERFLDDKKKMVFETYNYDANNPSANKAIVNNGNIKVSFLKEKQYQHTKVYSKTAFSPLRQHLSCCDLFSTSSLDGSFSTSSFSTSSFSTSSSSFSTSFDSTFESNIKETGRVEKGEDSNQQFKEVNHEFGDVFHVVEFILKPMSEKTFQFNDVKTYCTNCGFKLKTKFNYCPKCGEKIN